MKTRRTTLNDDDDDDDDDDNIASQPLAALHTNNFDFTTYCSAFDIHIVSSTTPDYSPLFSADAIPCSALGFQCL
jgi:hypothetical protein